MFFRSEVADPADLQRLADAFDKAWISINAVTPIDPAAASVERERLSYILTHLWQSDPDADIATIAAERFNAGAGAARSAAKPTADLEARVR